MFEKPLELGRAGDVHDEPMQRSPCKGDFTKFFSKKEKWATKAWRKSTSVSHGVSGSSVSSSALAAFSDISHGSDILRR